MKKHLFTTAFAAAFIVFSAFITLDARPVHAEEAPTATTASSDAAEEAVCPNCGAKVSVGSHGQTGRTMVCPSCGKEFCPMKEEASPFCGGVDTGFFSKYVARGVVYTNDPVFQPYVWLSYKKVTASVWGNMDMTSINSVGGNMYELDFTLDYSDTIDKFGYSVGGVYYAFNSVPITDTAEVYAAVSYDTILQPKLTLYYDFLDVDGFYGLLSISHSFELPEVASIKSSFDLKAQTGIGSRRYNGSYFAANHLAFVDAVFTAELPITLTEHIAIKPVATYSTVLDHTIRSKNMHNDNFILGAVLSGSF